MLDLGDESVCTDRDADHKWPSAGASTATVSEAGARCAGHVLSQELADGNRWTTSSGEIALGNAVAERRPKETHV